MSISSHATSTALVIDPDPAAGSTIARALEPLGVRVWHARTAAQARAFFDGNMPVLVVLELALPDNDGLLLCSELRSRTPAPIIICAKDASPVDRILSLKLGADAAVSKPFDPDEFAARAEALMRRASQAAPTSIGGAIPAPMVAAAEAAAAAASRPAPTFGAPAAQAAAAPPATLQVGPLTMEPARRRVTLHGARLDLTPSQFRLLGALMARPEETVTRQELAELLSRGAPPVSSRTVDRHICHLRARLEAGPLPAPSILGVYGRGYRLTQRAKRTRRSAA